MLFELMTIVPDLLAQVPTDTTVAGEIAGDLAEYVELLILAAFGVVNKLIVDGAKFVEKQVGKLPGPVVATIAFATAQAIVFVNAFLVGWGAPALSDDPAALAVGIQGLVVWATSMGWHSLVKALRERKES